MSQHAKVTVRRVDADHGDTLAAWEKMGKPKYPTQEQIAALKKASEIGPAEVRSLRDGELTVSARQKGLALIEIRWAFQPTLCSFADQIRQERKNSSPSARSVQSLGFARDDESILMKVAEAGQQSL